MRAAEPYGLNGQSQRERAFTLTDLITVLAVVILLTMLDLPSAATTRGKGQSASCLNNHRQLVRAWQLYADANGGRLAGNLDGGDVMTLANSNRTWVLGWFDFNGGAPAGANTNTLLLTAYSELAPYLNRQAEVFKCPADTSLSRGRTGVPRVRSVCRWARARVARFAESISFFAALARPVAGTQTVTVRFRTSPTSLGVRHSVTPEVQFPRSLSCCVPP